MDQKEQLGKYQLESVLGRGSMGVVYLARDLALGHPVAVKTLRKEALEDCNDGSLLQRFKNEALAGRRLKHPNIVSIYDYGEDGDHYYLVMEFVQGKQLRDYFQENYRFTTTETAALMRQLLDALDYAHRSGVVHRDINPNNLLVTANGDLSVMDFGIAKLDASAMTRTGVVMGTPAYMSPEQCLGQTVDQRSDIFSAGAILYHLLAGERPFGGNSALSTMQQVLNLTPVMPSLVNVQAPLAVDRIVAKALAKQPDERFSTAQEFATALDSALDPAPKATTESRTAETPSEPHATPTLTPQPVATPTSARDSMLGELGAAILGGFGAVALVWYVVYAVAPLLPAMDKLPRASQAATTTIDPQQTEYDRLNATLPAQPHTPPNNVTDEPAAPASAALDPARDH
jgi:serine/threonine protein kinase